MSVSAVEFAADLTGVDPNDFAARFRELFANSGLSQAELARRTGLPQPNISVWLSGSSTPRANIVPILAAALGCDPAEFFVAPQPKRGRPRKADD